MSKGHKRMRGRTYSLREAVKEHKRALAVYLVLRGLVIAIIVLSILQRKYENLFMCAMALVMFNLPSLFERRLSIEIPDTLEIIIYLFIYAAQILGEMRSFYVRFPFWDTMLHMLNGFICAGVGLALINLINHRSHSLVFRLSPPYVAIAAFCFSMTVGVLWEFFEYGMDSIVHTDMQKDTVVHAIYTVTLDETKTNKVVAIKDIQRTEVNGQDLGVDGYLDIGLNDTMKDLFVNCIGAVVFSIYGYFYAKREEKVRFIEGFIPYSTKKPEEPPEM
ncbi:MAG: hypothetical protein LKE39_08185 [Sphaerochaeta sp.]|nr:hypothetical protein [Sphaerochaeta sp.]MCI2045718.1 hypothetical protein [Sphaerochaeta sp.]MCI2105005.1 hypothetical protein [Sphaerochaeta sp.]